MRKPTAAETPKWMSSLVPEGMGADTKGRACRERVGQFYVGCEGCPLDGKKKLLGLDEISGRVAMLWGISPTRDDVQAGEVFAGEAGSWLLDRFAALGLGPELFDRQYVVRCRSSRRGEGGYEIEREPTPEEVAHCSGWTKKALKSSAGRAQVHLAFGEVAGRALLGAEYRGDVPIQWSERLQAKVFCFDSLSYIRRANIPDGRRDEFEARLRAAAYCVQNPDRFAYLNSLPVSVIRTPEALAAKLALIQNSGERPALDIEDGMVRGKAKVLSLAFSWEPGRGVCLVLDHPGNNLDENRRAAVWEVLREYLEDDRWEKIWHYGSYDVDRLFELAGIQCRGYTFDTTYAHYLRRTYIRSHGLAAIALQDFPDFAGYKDVVASYHSMPGGLANCPIPILSRYNAADAILTKLIELQIRDEVNPNLVRIYVGAGLTLRRMEDRGPRLDRTLFQEAERLIPAKVKALRDEIRIMADDPSLNPNGSGVIAEVMYDKLGLPTLSDVSPETAREGQDRSTAEDVLSIIAAATQHPFPTAVMAYRKYAKMVSTYLKGYGRSADLHQGQVCTKWFLTGAVTGRLRSGGAKDGVAGVVNLQNLHGSPYLQNLLVSDVDWPRVLNWGGGEIPDDILDLDVFISRDYSQIEVRMLAEVSGDAKLLAAYRAGKDIHCYVGTTLNPDEWSWDLVKHDKAIRRFVKECHFGIIFGLDAKGLYWYLKAKGVNTTPEKAAEFHESYFRMFPGVAKYIRRQRDLADRDGFVDTMFGFRRWIGRGVEDDRTTNPENQAVNTPIQGSAHTLVLGGLALLAEDPERFSLLQEPLMEIHDAMVWRTKLRYLSEAAAQSKYLMEEAVPDFLGALYKPLRVPIQSEGSAGFRYGVMLDYEGGDVPEFLGSWLEKNQKVEAKIREEFPLLGEGVSASV